MRGATRRRGGIYTGQPFTGHNIPVEWLQKVFKAFKFLFCFFKFYVTDSFHNGINPIFLSKFYTTSKFYFTCLLKKMKGKKTCTSSKYSTPFSKNLQIKLRCIMVSPIILERSLDLKWNPVEVNSVDWTCFGKAHTCRYKVPKVTAHIRAQAKHGGQRNNMSTSETGLPRGKRRGREKHSVFTRLTAKTNTILPNSEGNTLILLPPSIYCFVFVFVFPHFSWT